MNEENNKEASKLENFLAASIIPVCLATVIAVFESQIEARHYVSINHRTRLILDMKDGSRDFSGGFTTRYVDLNRDGVLDKGYFAFCAPRRGCFTGSTPITDEVQRDYELALKQITQ